MCTFRVVHLNDGESKMRKVSSLIMVKQSDSMSVKDLPLLLLSMLALSHRPRLVEMGQCTMCLITSEFPCHVPRRYNWTYYADMWKTGSSNDEKEKA